MEQSFNSLHAQREACESYVKSQQHEGWTVVPKEYDDGGFSGGTMERPALRNLLQDIRDGKVDVVVVYKIDRLTRSLFDFAKIVETFDAASVSFVSVTQSFNTTTSMGRLTLNVLLSFAQFEREVTGERIRDKIAASRRKGMWMGGNIPLGYDLSDHKLIINEAEAERVRTIFDLYLRLGTVKRVQAELDRRGIRSKSRPGKGDGDLSPRANGNQPFKAGHLYYLLRSPIYVGSVRHRGQVHPGQHLPIIDQTTWDAVQKQLADKSSAHSDWNRGHSPSLLVGKVFDDAGRRLTPTHTAKGATRYRYYATADGQEPTIRIPAIDLERIVIDAVVSWLSEYSNIASLADEGASTMTAHQKAREFGTRLSSHSSEGAETVRQLLQRVEFGSDKIILHISESILRTELGFASSRSGGSLMIEQPCSITRRGKVQRLIVASQAMAPSIDVGLVNAIVRARRWFEALQTRKVISITDLGRTEGVPRAWVSHQLPLAFLAPDIVEMIVTGRQPTSLTLEGLLQAAVITDWTAQRTLMA